MDIMLRSLLFAAFVTISNAAKCPTEFIGEFTSLVSSQTQDFLTCTTSVNFQAFPPNIETLTLGQVYELCTIAACQGMMKPALVKAKEIECSFSTYSTSTLVDIFETKCGQPDVTKGSTAAYVAPTGASPAVVNQSPQVTQAPQPSPGLPAGLPAGIPPGLAAMLPPSAVIALSNTPTPVVTTQPPAEVNSTSSPVVNTHVPTISHCG